MAKVSKEIIALAAAGAALVAVGAPEIAQTVGNLGNQVRTSVAERPQAEAARERRAVENEHLPVRGR